MSAGRAVVIGGSMGGLLAARVLADHFSEVVLFDRDVFPQPGENRKGVPQGQHAHALLSSGRQVMEKYFPGFRDELHQQGALKGDYNVVRWFDNGVYHSRFDGLEVLLISRPRLEAHVRTRLSALPNVRVTQQHDVDSLIADGPRVTGVRVRPVPGGAAQALDAALVVDATGRGSQTPAWLEQLGFPRPAEDTVRVGLAYATRVYRRTAAHLNGDLGVICPSSPPGRRGGVAIAMEGDRWMVTLFGMLGECPPTEEGAFLEYARSLPAPDIHQIVAQAEPLTDLIAFKFPQSTRRRYESLPRFPEGYLVFGDALCSFNPIYGQGMSTAALQASALEGCLAQGREAIAPRFFAAAAKVIDGPWTMAVGGDLRYDEVEGARTGMGRFINWYIGKLHIAAGGDPAVARAFHRVANLLDPPPSILQPGIAWRVLQGNLRKAPTRH